MSNAYIEKLVDNQVQKLIAQKKLYTPQMVDKQVLENLDVWTKMMTVAVNRGLGIGKKRFTEKAQPLLDQLVEDFFHNKETADQEYALSVVERLYAEVME